MLARLKRLSPQLKGTKGTRNIFLERVIKAMLESLKTLAIINFFLNINLGKKVIYLM